MREVEKFAVAGFLYNKNNNKVLLHLRDGNTEFNPHKWAFFGGLGEEGERPVEAFMRELQEEVGLSVLEKDVKVLGGYFNSELKTDRYVFFVDSSVEVDQLTLGEGAELAWISLAEVDDYDLTEKTKKDLGYFVLNYKE